MNPNCLFNATRRLSVDGGVSKIVSKASGSPALSRACVATQNAGQAMLTGVGRVPYHTFAGKTRRMSMPGTTFASSSLKFNNISVNSASLPTPKLPREIVWLLGAPGAGKGTNSSFVANSRGIQAPTIVMSSLLENPECKRIKDAGGMVDDATVCRALLEELSKPEYRNGVVVDGFPRTKEQAEWLSNLHDSLSETGIAPKYTFVMLSLSEEVAVARQLSRGNAIRELNNVRQLSGMDALEERATDLSEAAARTRYRVFAEQYEAVTQLGSRFSLATVDADAPIDMVRLRLSSALGKPSFSTPRPQPSFSESVSRMSKLAFAY